MYKGQPAANRSRDNKGDYEKVKLLFDYTKFHIGIYTGLATTVIAAYNLHVFEVWECPMWISVGLIALAGLAGGVVASTLPECNSLKQFFDRPTGFWGFRPFSTPFSGRTWTRIEHTSFWLGLAFGVAAFTGRHPYDRQNEIQVIARSSPIQSVTSAKSP